MHKENNSSPVLKPCGTSLLVYLFTEMRPFNLMGWVRLYKYDLTKRNK